MESAALAWFFSQQLWPEDHDNLEPSKKKDKGTGANDQHLMLRRRRLSAYIKHLLQNLWLIEFRGR